MLQSVNSTKTRIVSDTSLITKRGSSRTRIVRNMILMLQCVNSNKRRTVMNTKLVLLSIEVARQGLPGIGYRCPRM